MRYLQSKREKGRDILKERKKELSTKERKIEKEGLYIEIQKKPTRDGN